MQGTREVPELTLGALQRQLVRDWIVHHPTQQTGFCWIDNYVSSLEGFTWRWNNLRKSGWCGTKSKALQKSKNTEQTSPPVFRASWHLCTKERRAEVVVTKSLLIWWQWTVVTKILINKVIYRWVASLTCVRYYIVDTSVGVTSSLFRWAIFPCRLIRKTGLRRKTPRLVFLGEEQLGKEMRNKCRQWISNHCLVLLAF